MHLLARTPVMDIRHTIGLGDQMTFTRLPELYHAEFGHRMQVLNNDQFRYVFANNPFVNLVTDEVLGDPPEGAFDPWADYGCAHPFVGMNPTYRHTVPYFPAVPRNLRPRLDVKPGPDRGPTLLFVSGGSQRYLQNRANEIPRDVLEPLIQHFGTRGVHVVNAGSPANYRPAGRYLDLAGRASVLEVAALMAAPDTVLLCVNSGLMHVANAVMPSERIFVYSISDVPNPLTWERWMHDLPNHDWLYGENTFFGRTAGWENVLAYDEAVARLEGLCIPSR